MISVEIPEGYKKTEIGVIPIDWEVKKLGEITKVKHGRDQKKIENINGIYPILGTGGVIGKTNEYLYNKPSILIGRKGTIDKPQFMNTPFWTVDTLFYTELILEINPIWLFNYFQIIDWYYYNQATGVPSLSASIISTIKLPFPPLFEQQKIAQILSTWDEAITNCKNTLLELVERKKWLAYNLVFGKKYSLVKLSDLVKRVKKPFTPEPKKLYRQIGIRSHTKGIFYKEEVSGLSLGNKSVFHIEPDCFIVNIVFAWEHAIAKTTANEIGMIASHRFPMFKPVVDKMDLDYLLHFFKSKKGKDLLNLASPGGAGRNKTLGQSEFLKLQIPVPDINEQKRISEILDTADAEILLYQQKLKALQLQKKGLMQQLLTGKTRVKIN